MSVPLRSWQPVLLIAFAGIASAQTPPSPPFEAIGAKVADRVLAVMGFQVIPDVTTTSLSIEDEVSGDPDLNLSQLGAGFTWSDDFPIYLEGMIAVSRYDPVFAATDGASSRRVPVHWDSAAVTVGVGWDFRLTDKLVFRPIANATIGYIASDLKVLAFRVGEVLDEEVQFLSNGGLHTRGYGGSVMLDYADYNDEREIDVELRYSYMHLETYGGPAALEGTAEVGDLNLWTRWRAPIGDWTAFDRPVRYVLEFTHSEFLHDERGVLGFDRLTSLGTGIELDLDAGGFFDRARVMGRYVFGEDVSGFGISFAVTF
jgi:hypothetical protein